MIEYEIIDDIPRAVIKRKKKATLTDKCPFCSHLHMHGPEEGYRDAQCSKNMRISAADGTVLRNVDGYVLREY